MFTTLGGGGCDAAITCSFSRLSSAIKLFHFINDAGFSDVGELSCGIQTLHSLIALGGINFLCSVTLKEFSSNWRRVVPIIQTYICISRLTRIQSL